MKRVLRAALLAATFAPMAPVTAEAAAPDRTEARSAAWFEGRWIDLSVDWEEATACDVRPDITLCFRSEAELDDADVTRVGAVEGAVVAPLSTCASSLRLYDGTSYGGIVLSLSTRGVPLNLSAYGFDNRTSSYKVGACDTDFYSAAFLGGSLYPGSTVAFAQAASMSSGWNNVVSSVYIS